MTTANQTRGANGNRLMIPDYDPCDHGSSTPEVGAESDLYLWVKTKKEKKMSVSDMRVAKNTAIRRLYDLLRPLSFLRWDDVLKVKTGNGVAEIKIKKNVIRATKKGGLYINSTRYRNNQKAFGVVFGKDADYYA